MQSNTIANAKNLKQYLLNLHSEKRPDDNDNITEDMWWFVLDFFKYHLNPIEKLAFWGYYMTGMTLEDLGERFDVSTSRAGQIIETITEDLSLAWKHKDKWMEMNHDCNTRDK